MTQYIKCGCCGQYHTVEFTGDCRQDSERWTFEEILTDIEGGTPDIEIIDLDGQKFSF